MVKLRFKSEIIVDPYANINESEFGSISGSVTDKEGKTLEEYDVFSSENRFRKFSRHV